MAIAIDNSQQAIAFATSVTYTGFTVTGSNMIGIVSVANQANAGGSWATDTSGVTFNGSAMTKIDVVQINSGYGNSVSLWGRLAPTTGNVVATRSTNVDRITICIATYSGVSQSTAIGSLTKTSLGTSSGSSFTGTLTAGTNSWVVLGTYISAGGGPGTAGSGTTLRVKDGEINYLFDSNGAVSGSTSLNVNCGGSFPYGYVMVSFDPASAAVANTTNFFMLKMR